MRIEPELARHVRGVAHSFDQRSTHFLGDCRCNRFGAEHELDHGLEVMQAFLAEIIMAKLEQLAGIA
ncbi:MAG: hypothetical protein ACRYGK_01005, partial [Janthinobacterium lividum]